MSAPLTHNSSRARRSQNSSSEEAYAGPIGSLPTPPVSPEGPLLTRSKRNKNKSSHRATYTSNAGLVIEDFRCAGPVYFPIPVSIVGTVAGDVQSAWDNGLAKLVMDILKANGFERASANAVRLASPFYTGSEQEEVADYIMIRTDGQAVNEQWIIAAERILLLCQSYNLTKINVDIADDRGLVLKMSSTISPDEPLVKEWESVRPHILKALQPNVTWISIDVVTRSNEVEVHGLPITYMPTILIQIQQHSTETWTTQRDRIDDYLKTNERYQHIAVEIIRGSLLGHGFDSELVHELEHHQDRLWQEQAYMGASIGRVNSNYPAGSGTLGCFVQLKKHINGTPTVRTCGLTNFHVAIPHDNREPEKGQPPYVLHWMRHGIKPDDIRLKELIMNMPSPRDHREALQTYTNTLLRKEGTVLGGLPYMAVQENLNQGMKLEDFMAKFYRPTFAALESEIRQDRDRIHAITSRYQNDGRNARLGTVFSASGLRQSGGILMDWALIDPLPSRTPSKNELPPHLSPSISLVSTVPGLEMRKSSIPTPGEEVFKIGRTTGITGGFINSVVSTKLRGWKPVGNGEIHYETGELWAIVRRHSVKERKSAASPNTQFSAGGDSGSAIFNREGEFKGLLLGAGTLLMDLTYFISADELFTDIKLLTGADDVSLLQTPLAAAEGQ